MLFHMACRLDHLFNGKENWMPVRIKIAETPAELEELFIARYKVFVEEEGYLASNNCGQIVDQFDAFPTTTNIIAMMDGHVVGGIRITTCSTSGLPSDHFYHFSPFFQDDPNSIAGVSQFFLRKNRRANNYRIGILLMGMCAYWANRHNLRHIVAAVNPVIAPLLKLIGMKPVESEFFHYGEGVHVLPMVGDMNQIRGPLVSFLERQRLHNCCETFDREYYLAGEQVIFGNHEDSDDFIVLEGKVCIEEQPSSESMTHNNPIMELGPGQSFMNPCHLFHKTNNLTVKTGGKTELMRARSQPLQTEFAVDVEKYKNRHPLTFTYPAGTAVH